MTANCPSTWAKNNPQAAKSAQIPPPATDDDKEVSFTYHKAGISYQVEVAFLNDDSDYTEEICFCRSDGEMNYADCYAVRNLTGNKVWTIQKFWGKSENDESARIIDFVLLARKIKKAGWKISPTDETEAEKLIIKYLVK